MDFITFLDILLGLFALALAWVHGAIVGKKFGLRWAERWHKIPKKKRIGHLLALLILLGISNTCLAQTAEEVKAVRIASTLKLGQSNLRTLIQNLLVQTMRTGEVVTAQGWIVKQTAYAHLYRVDFLFTEGDENRDLGFIVDTRTRDVASCTPLALELMEACAPTIPTDTESSK